MPRFLGEISHLPYKACIILTHHGGIFHKRLSENDFTVIFRYLVTVCSKVMLSESDKSAGSHWEFCLFVCVISHNILYFINIYIYM